MPRELSRPPLDLLKQIWSGLKNTDKKNPGVSWMFAGSIDTS